MTRCTNTTAVDKLCCPDVEFLLLKCRSFYLPKEFLTVYICTVYISPDANTKLMLAQFHDSMVYHDSVNHIDTVLHLFHQNVKWATRSNNTIHQVYTNVANAYRAQVFLHLGLSDHLLLLLYPRYAQKIWATRLLVRSVWTWPEDTVPRLQDCFHTTDWAVISGQGTLTCGSLDEFTATVLNYITFFLHGRCYNMEADVFPTQKLWITCERKIEAHFYNSANSQMVWEGIREITGYKDNIIASY